MPNFWDHFSRGPPRQRKLQDGLFQIASQTCSLLVQVNNTNNISYGNNATNIHLNNLQTSTTRDSNNDCTNTSTSTTVISETDEEQLLVLIPPTRKTPKYKSGILSKPRLSTVLEHATKPSYDDTNWHCVPSDNDASPAKSWNHKSKVCRPSCIPISAICILIFLVVLLPLLDHTNEKALRELNRSSLNLCQNSCHLRLIESIPEGLIYKNSTISNPSTFDTWLGLINSANQTIDIASFYWTLRQSEVYPDPSSVKGEIIFQALLRAGLDRSISIRIAQNTPTQNNPNIDTELLVKRKAAEVRSLNFAKLLGGGVLHTKFWIIDNRHIYIGSANMDWRALTQVKELGIAIYNCTCLAEDLGKIFEVYWKLGEVDAKIPDSWPEDLWTDINMRHPFNLTSNNEVFQTFISSSPPPFNPKGRTNDVDALVDVINRAEKYIYIAVMDYFPLTIYTPKIRYWPIIENAIKSAAINNYVKIKMLISWWNHSRPAEDNFLKSIASIDKVYPRVSIEIRRFRVPADEQQQKIPYARVNHNKYMVTDNTAFIGTSNWSGDYFTDTAGVSFILHDPIFDRNTSHVTLRSQLQDIFLRDWYSKYSYPLRF